MFKLVTIEDTVVVPSRLFGYGRSQALEHMINRQMSDRVIPGIGLVVALWDIISLGDEKLARHTGQATSDCRFRVLVFAPFVGEAIPARIGPSTDAGILTYTHFFNLIWVPREALPRPSTFDANDQVWAWRPSVGGEDDGEGQQVNDETDGEGVVANYMDGGNETVVRVTSVQYDESGGSNAVSSGSGGGDGSRSTSTSGVNSSASESISTRTSYVMVIKASMYDEVSEDNQGLGDPAWWYEEDEAAAEVDGADDGDGYAEDENEEYDENGEDGDEYAEGQEEWQEDETAQAEDELVHDEGGEAAVDAEVEDE